MARLTEQSYLMLVSEKPWRMKTGTASFCMMWTWYLRMIIISMSVMNTIPNIWLVPWINFSTSKCFHFFGTYVSYSFLSRWIVWMWIGKDPTIKKWEFSFFVLALEASPVKGVADLNMQSQTIPCACFPAPLLAQLGNNWQICFCFHNK